jgi:hypothetical protein
MCPGRSDERARGGGCAMVALMGAVALSGCSGASSIVDSSPSIGSRFANLFSSAKPGVTQPASPTPSAPEVECPGVDIRTGASTLEVAAKSEQPTAGDLRYQLSLGQTARECLVQAGTMSIKVGVQGRVILGPMGAPGQINVPLRYAVVREGPQPKTVVTKFKRVAVAVPADQTHVQFVDVEEGLSFPLPPKSELEAYVVYVGFDEIADRNEKKPAKSGKKLAPRPQ